MKILFMGTSEFAVPILKTLHERFEVVGVVTQPDRPKGRKRLVPSAVKIEAEALNLPVHQPEKLAAETGKFLEEPLDFIVTAAYGQKVPAALLKHPRFEALNVHASLLPKYRGAAPIARVIEQGEKETGVSIMRMVEKMDAGDVFMQKTLSLNGTETKGVLQHTLSLEGAKVLPETIEAIAQGELHPTPQNEDEATYAHKIRKEEAGLDFREPAVKLERKIRAHNPSPGAYFKVNGQPFKVHAASVVQGKSAAPGTIVHRTKDRVDVQTGEDALSLLKVQPAGKKAMDIKAYLNGAGRNAFILEEKIA